MTAGQSPDVVEPDEVDELAGAAAGVELDEEDEPLSELDDDVDSELDGLELLDELDFFEARLSVL